MKLNEKAIKLTGDNNSLKTTLPISFTRSLGWSKGEQLKCKLVGKKLILTKED